MRTPLQLLERQSLRLKLILGFGAMLLLALALGIQSLRTQTELQHEMQYLYQMEVVGVSRINDARVYLTRMSLAARRAVGAETLGAQDEALKLMDEARVKLHHAIEMTRPTLEKLENIQRLQDFESLLANMQRVEQSALELSRKGLRPEAMSLLDSLSYQTMDRQADELLDNIVAIKEASVRDKTQAVRDYTATRNVLTYVLLLGGMGLALALAGLVSLSIRGPIGRVRRAVDALAAGQLDEVIPHTDLDNETGDLARAIALLQIESQQLDAQRRIKAQDSALQAQLQQADSSQLLLERFFAVLAVPLQLALGAYYRFDDQRQCLLLTASYAGDPDHPFAQEVALGEGLLGQCALDRQPRQFDTVPADHWTIRSAFGRSPPGHLLVLPVLEADRLMGVLVLAGFAAPAQNEQALLDELLPRLAISLVVMERNEAVRTLLAQTQRQADDLEAHAARVEEQAVELEAQQAALMETEAWYRGIIEAAPDGMLVVDEHGGIMLTNPQLDHLFGYAAGQLIGKPIETLVPQAKREQHMALRDGFIAHGSARQMGGAVANLQGVRKDGSLFSVEISLSKLPVLEGRGVCVCASVRDITERRKMQAAIEASEAQLRGVLDSSPVAMCIEDGTGLLLYGNRQLEALFGTSFAAMRHPQGRIALWQDPNARQVFTEAVAQGDVLNFEAAMQRADGSHITVLISSIALIHGEALLRIEWFFDISARKQAEAAVVQTQERFRRVLEAAPAGLQITNEDTDELLFTNPKLDQVFGDPFALVRENPFQHRYWEDSEAEQAFQQLTRAQDDVRDFPARYLRRDGSHCEVLMSATRIRMPDMTICGSWYYDITDARDAQARLEERMAELERFKQLTIDREIRMIELKTEINALLQASGQAEKYTIVE